MGRGVLVQVLTLEVPGSIQIEGIGTTQYQSWGMEIMTDNERSTTDCCQYEDFEKEVFINSS